MKEAIPEFRHVSAKAARTAAITAIHANDKKATKVEGGGDMEIFYKHFLAVLCPEYWTEVVKASKKTLYQSLMVAKYLELLMQDKGHRVDVAAILTPKTPTLSSQ